MIFRWTSRKKMITGIAISVDPAIRPPQSVFRLVPVKYEIQTVAVCFVNSYANPAHELRMREILEEELPGVDVSTSSEVLPEIFEHERFSTTVANAVLAPLVGIQDAFTQFKALVEAGL